MSLTDSSHNLAPRSAIPNPWLKSDPKPVAAPTEESNCMTVSRAEVLMEERRSPRATSLRSRVRQGRARIHRVRRLLNRMEWPLAILALLVVPVLILEDRSTDPTIRWLCSAINWFVWLAFVGEFGLQMSVARKWGSFLRASWGKLLIILLSPPFLVPDGLQTIRGVRAFRILRLMRLVRGGAVATIGLRSAKRALGSHGFPYVMVVAAATIALGAAAIYLVEQETVRSPADALWWAVVTVTTVGYGDVSPVSGEGRLIALVLMCVGVVVISILTATLSSFFVEEGTDKEYALMARRLSAMERRLEEVVIELRRSNDGKEAAAPTIAETPAVGT
jgi:voltage-gated potassium channel